MEDGGQGMEASVATTGVREFGEDISERECRHKGLQYAGDAGPHLSKTQQLANTKHRTALDEHG
jgi:hypothetical protein